MSARVHEDVLGARFAGHSQMEPGEEIWLFGVREELDAVFMPKVFGGDAEIDESGATTDGEFPLLRVNHGKRTASIGEQFDIHGIDAEEPRLRVVAGGSEDGVSKEELELIRGKTIGGKSVGENIPGFEMRIHCVTGVEV
jgi:hypothetical protein